MTRRACYLDAQLVDELRDAYNNLQVMRSFFLHCDAPDWDLIRKCDAYMREIDDLLRSAWRVW